MTFSFWFSFLHLPSSGIINMPSDMQCFMCECNLPAELCTQQNSLLLEWSSYILKSILAICFSHCPSLHLCTTLLPWMGIEHNPSLFTGPFYNFYTICYHITQSCSTFKSQNIYVRIHMHLHESVHRALHNDCLLKK